MTWAPCKNNWLQTSGCFLPGREKADWLTLPFAFSRAGKKHFGSDFQFAFSRPRKKANLLRLPGCRPRSCGLGPRIRRQAHKQNAVGSGPTCPCLCFAVAKLLPPGGKMQLDLSNLEQTCSFHARLMRHSKQFSRICI